ncbi:spore germination protein [Paenibacillus phyllosphaerae]|uniref:Spore germination protein n=1 Tax=Paenibacillus phyllosphaerae TaxID=274593 RepID=A0A7W5FPJ5_9BACL|nr:Ger(x)C family spore germination protein [Paenibacillus phyllosphaerae]MBB3112094.1 spore germination protein [Paenibacillus phyllosphaerae]
MMTRRMMFIASLVAFALLVTGCRDQRIIERMGFTRTVAFDLPPDDGESQDQKDKMLRVTLSIPKAQPENSRIVLTTTAHSSKEARVIVSRKNNRRIVSGQLRSALFGSRLAKEGLWKYIDTLVRDPSIGSKVNVVIVSGNANALLERDFKQYPSTGEYIDDLLRNASGLTEIPQANLHTFARDYFDKGVDPVAPLLKEDKQTLSVDGIALFRSDRYVGRIPPTKSLLFSFLHDNIATGEIVMKLPGAEGAKDEMIMLSFVASKRKITAKVRKPVRSGDDVAIDIRLRISGEVLEYTGKLNLQKTEDQLVLEKQMKAYVEKETKTLIEEILKLKSDPFGFGKKVRNQISYREWDKLQWHDAILPGVSVQVHADVKVKDIGKLQEADPVDEE